MVAERADVVRRLPEVVQQSAGIPLFLFVDPTGVGLPFDDLVAALNRPRNARGWPQTEALINLSYDAIRRIGGHVTSPSPNQKTMATLDEAMGGDWWRGYFVDGVTHEAVEGVVAEFVGRLGHSVGPGTFVASIPVRRDTHQKPLYSLVFVTRNHRAEWHIGDIAAKCLDEGRIAADEAAGRLAMSRRWPSRSDTAARRASSGDHHSGPQRQPTSEQPSAAPASPAPSRPPSQRAICAQPRRKSLLIL